MQIGHAALVLTACRDVCGVIGVAGGGGYKEKEEVCDDAAPPRDASFDITPTSSAGGHDTGRARRFVEYVPGKACLLAVC